MLATKKNSTVEVRSLNDFVEVPDKYYSIDLPKIMLGKMIVTEAKKQGLSMRKLGEKIDMKHPQLVRVTSANNYNIDTILKILNGLDMELVVRKKSK
ncbi:hypothetical protein [Listeria booriae]|uniref:HTH cro/C1-type domain-containing protein n=1 Tax=Listeria booriae TaxID=1552123 RepID=A0A7X0Z283_9LIST|nr:hypothetical protein [Listeria booriae]MBC1227419.1 hypothetical protein [Listeria booriae]MBC1234054.1 hypothetical protein [Listeria booriae]MBC1246302.1 hypothetical protein [Listeria booriae]MBC1307762.1 hypothetical protein [Listeria booriae]MBC1373185.1 hypothetical protein [Listeria booriae]